MGILAQGKGKKSLLNSLRVGFFGLP